MDDRTRFKLAGYGSFAGLLVGVILLATAIFIGVRLVQAVLRGRVLDVFIMLGAAGILYGVWYVTTYLVAGLLTNNTQGYRPWTWGMIPRNEHGASAQEFDIPLTYAEASVAFLDASDPRIKILRRAAAEASGSEDAPSPDRNAV